MAGVAVATKLARQPIINALQPMSHIMTMACSAELGHLPTVLAHNVGLFKSFSEGGLKMKHLNNFSDRDNSFAYKV